jgi:hypothetical protein
VLSFSKVAFLKTFVKTRIMEKTFIYDQHQKHQDWLSRVTFYKEEINILKERLTEMTARNNAREFLVSVEHFENQFKLQRNNLDELAHSIKQHENQLVAEINSNPVAVDHRKIETDGADEDFMSYFERNFANLREEFNKFSAKWM